MCQTYLVTGGYDGDDWLSSTELLAETAAAWVFTGQLPTPRSGLRGANIDNKILVTGRNKNLGSFHIFETRAGGYDGEATEDILEFLPTLGEWRLQDRLSKARGYHVMSVVRLADIEQFCHSV